MWEWLDQPAFKSQIRFAKTIIYDSSEVLLSKLYDVAYTILKLILDECKMSNLSNVTF